MRNKKYLIQYFGLVAVLFFALGFFTQFLVEKHMVEKPVLAETNMDLFWHTWNVLEEKYPFEEPVDQEKMHAAIGGLVDSYQDRHMAFFPPTKSRSFAEDIAGEFGGAGMEVSFQSGYVVVVAPLKNSAADRAGILAGDVITGIDGEDISGLDFETAISQIRGKVGTTLDLEIVRQGEESELDISLVREIVKIPILDTEIVGDVFIIHFYTFSERSERDFEKALQEFRDSDAKKLLIDLRNNPGGFLSSAINVTSYFLEQGLTVVKEYDGNDDSYEKAKKYRSSGYETLNEREYELSVLINQGSASASEIVAGALRDHDKAIIYGQESFGKGSVQELVELPHDTSLKVTISKWLTPDNIEISGRGIAPDVVFEKDLLEETLKVLNTEK